MYTFYINFKNLMAPRFKCLKAATTRRKLHASFGGKVPRLPLKVKL